jgi:VCBS repeat-containing protein
MTTKSLLFIGTLALASIASAKSYDIVLSGPTKAGALQLNAGEYSLKVKGSNAVFTNMDTGKSFTAAVTVKAADKKFENTAVDTQKQNGTDEIKTIELGGSNTQLQLGE